MPERVKHGATRLPAKSSQGQPSLKPDGPARKKKPSPRTEEAELGPEIQHGQLSADELNSRNDL